MKQQTVQSSNLKSVSWDSGNLTVEFHRGAEYVYHDVPEKVYDELVAAPSVGKFFIANVRESYKWTQSVGAVAHTSQA